MNECSKKNQQQNVRNHDNFALETNFIWTKKKQIDPHQFTYIYMSIALILENIMIIDDKRQEIDRVQDNTNRQQQQNAQTNVNFFKAIK